MLSDDDLKKAYWKARSEIGGDAAGLRAVAEAAVKDAVGGDEPVLELEILGNLMAIQKLRTDLPNGVHPLYARPQASAAVPDDVMQALERMEIPLHESVLSHSLTAEADARCMKLIGDFIRSLAASQPEVKE